MMCGIFGFNWEDEELAKNIGSLLYHRGPDGEGCFVKKGISIGHRRLSIIDLSERGKQPMSNEQKTLWITYNGEIFNFQELRSELVKRGHRFKSRTDTEVLLHGFEEWNWKVLEKIEGQFAFCIFDVKKKELFLARDPVGINPLFYYYDGKKFIFSSELKGILSCGIERVIERDALHHYLLYGYLPTNKSIFKNTFKLSPGTYLRFNLRTKEITKQGKYWNPEVGEKQQLDEEQLLKLLKESVQKRLVADVPVGAFLSGGVDSSAIVGLASKFSSNINTFSIRFDVPSFNESDYAAIVSKHFKTQHTEICFKAEDVKKLIRKLPLYFDEPFADPSMIPTFLVAQVAAKRVKVCLTGDGADELFGGYERYRLYQRLRIYDLYPGIINKICYQLLRPFKGELSSKIRTFFEIGSLPREQQLARTLSYLNKEEFILLTGQTPERIYKNYPVQHRQNRLEEACITDLYTYLPSDGLTKVDRASMANSLETRPPFLDSRIIKFALKIKPELKISHGTTKYFLKKSLQKLLPGIILSRRKQGFAVPLEHYFKGTLSPLLEKYVFSYNKHNFFREEYLVFLREKLKLKRWRKNYGRILWTILMFNLWWDTWANQD